MSRCVPFDSEASDTRLLREHVTAHTLDVHFGRRLGIELLRIVLVVHVVSHADELPIVVAA